MYAMALLISLLNSAGSLRPLTTCQQETESFITGNSINSPLSKYFSTWAKFYQQLIFGSFVILPLHWFLWCWISISVKTWWHLSQMYSLGPGIAMATSSQSGNILLSLRSLVNWSEYVPRLILSNHRYFAFIVALNKDSFYTLDQDLLEIVKISW